MVNGRDSRRVTIKDIAREAGVSYATVSRALSEGKPVNEKTRQKILEVCQRMGYTPNSVARSMVMGESRLLGVIIPSIDNPFMSETAYHIERYAREQGYNIMLCNSFHSLDFEAQTFELLLGRQVDGVLFFPSHRESYHNIKKYLKQVPTVFVNEHLSDKPVSYVATDNFQGSQLGVEYLLELGHRQILYLGRNSNTATHELRAKGYHHACQKNGLSPLFWDSPYEDTTIEAGYEMAKELFRKPRYYTAMMASTDTLALGVLQAAEELGIAIPGDISLLGFDNIRYAALPKINLSTIEQPKQAMATAAMDMLLESIANDYEAYSHRVLMPTLVRRSSCGPVSPTTQA